jgi:hypothetical protein
VLPFIANVLLFLASEIVITYRIENKNILAQKYLEGNISKTKNNVTKAALQKKLKPYVDYNYSTGLMLNIIAGL